MSALEFIFRDGPDAGKRLPLPVGRFTIGSGEGCALRLSASLVRERHAEVRTSAEGLLEIADLTGANLLWVDGEPRTRAPLLPGSEVRLGRVTFEVGAKEEEAGAVDSTFRRQTPFRPSQSLRTTDAPEEVFEPTTISGRFAPGDLVDKRYRIVARLAAGGMGEVFKVEHLELGKQLALKVMLPGLTADPDFVNRFKIEAVAASRIGHPNIVDISDFGQTAGGRFYFVMEFLDGLTLSSVLHREGAQPPLRVADLGWQVARALAAAHELHIVHRDLKPDNVMVMQRPGNPDLAKVLDFGVARVQVDSQSIGQTMAGLVVGTPQYMSPEQAKAMTVDARSDIYSLGLILHELLVGSPAFSGETPSVVMVKQVTEPAPQLPEAVPTELSELISRMLEKNPADRPQQMKEVVEVLDALRHQLKSNELQRGAATQSKRSGKNPAHAPRGKTPAPAHRATPVRGPTPMPEPQDARPTVAAPELAPEPLPAASPRVLVGVLLGLTLVVGGGGGLLLAAGRSPAPPPLAQEDEAAPAEAPLPEPEPEPAKPAEAPREVVVRILSSPEGVEVFEKGVMLGNTPLPLRRLPNTILELSFSLAGYQTAERKVMVSADAAEVNVTLEKSRVQANKPRPPVDTRKDLKGLPSELELKPAPF